MAPLRFLAPDTDAAPGKPPVFFIPGWAYDGQVLDLLEERPAWYSTADFIVPSSFQKDLRSFLDSAGFDRVALVGWSMGANLCLDFARLYPDRVAALALLSVRRSWPAHEIDRKRAELASDRGSTLNDFYRKSFLGYRNMYTKFQERLLGEYLKKGSFHVLDEGLRYLGDADMGGPLPTVRSKCLHGEKDVIAPAEERGFAEEHCSEILAREGHAIFLGRGLMEVKRFLVQAAGS